MATGATTRPRSALGQLIGLLRGADFSLDEIALVIEDLKVGVDVAVQRLEVLLAASSATHAAASS